MRYEILRLPLASSCIIHLLVLVIATAILHHQKLRREDFVPIVLIDTPRAAAPVPMPKLATPPALKTPASPPKVEKPTESKQTVKTEIAKIEKPAPPPTPAIKEEPNISESKPTPPVKSETPPSLPSRSNVEGGGSAAGAGNVFGKGDVAVLPGSGTSGGGGGTAASSLGRNSGVPGLPMQSAPLRTNREAKPIQTARANYPPMALRMGMEGDVTLKIIVDPDGSVSKAEIVKSGGAGFDEEALKAIKQSRFEPAQREGQNVTAEFTYIYRFRLQR